VNIIEKTNIWLVGDDQLIHEWKEN